MEQIIKLQFNAGKVAMGEDMSSALKNLFSGCRVSFLLGAGFSANILGTLGNNEIAFEALEQYQPLSDDNRKKASVLTAFMYWSFFCNCIVPIKNINYWADPSFKAYFDFGNTLYRIFSERGNPAIDRQFNVFTTNYDPIIEIIFDQSNCICNDGFEGRIHPCFSTDNYSKSFYRQAVFSNRKAEIPSLNLIKLHGSLTWTKDVATDAIVYQDYISIINDFYSKYEPFFDSIITSSISSHFTAKTVEDAANQLNSFFSNSILDGILTRASEFETFVQDYKSTFLIVNPTKEKFSSTLQNKNYYELLRIFSNELEKENALLVCNGFSFRDEHILDLVKRSMVNPSLKVLIFCYEESKISEYKRLFGAPKNNNISYIYVENEKLSLEVFNQILSHIHA